jgi:diacylglycerol kinase family enzyme
MAANKLKQNEDATNCLLIYNPKSGMKILKHQKGLSNILTILKDNNFIPRVVVVNRLAILSNKDLPASRLVIVAGGDGTINAVVNKFIEHEITLGIIPFGTYNHLAKDLNIPLDIASCVALIVKGKLKRIDVAKANGYFFLNNSSIGLYSEAVRYRLLFRKWVKWLAMTFATINVLKDLPLLKASYEFEGKELTVTTPLVFVSNNAYELDLLNLARRKTLEEGLLYLYINSSTSRSDFLKLLFGILLRRKKHIKGKFAIHAVTQCKISLAKKLVDITIDGEVLRVNAPLLYEIQPRKLTVITSEEQR